MIFFECFRIVGTLSVLVWMVSAFALWRSRRRKTESWKWLFIALGSAVLAWYLGRVNSESIMNIMIDRREEIARVIAEHEAMQDEDEKQIGASYAEDAPGDELAAKDLRPVQPDGKKAAVEVTAPSAQPVVSSVSNETAGMDMPSAEPEYRSRGKQTRDEGKEAKGKEEVKVDLELKTIRYMKEDDRMAAMRLNRANRSIIRLLLLGTLWLIALDYLRAFNATRTTRWLVPIGGRWIDPFSPKARLVLMPPADKSPVSPEEYSRAVLHRGENLVFFGQRDPWPETGRLGRIQFRSWPIWGLSKLVAGAPHVPPVAEFLLDGAWFGRYAVVIPADGSANGILSEMIELLWRRHETGAAARRTLHIVWALPRPPGPDTIDAVRRMGGDIDLRLAVWAQDGNEPAHRELFEQVV